MKRPILTQDQVSEMTEWATDRRMDSPRMAGSVLALAEQIHVLCEEIKDLRRQIAEIDRHEAECSSVEAAKSQPEAASGLPAYPWCRGSADERAICTKRSVCPRDYSCGD